MTRLERMLEQHAKLVRTNRELLDSATDDQGNTRALSQDERDEFEGNMATIKELSQDITNLRALEEEEARMEAGEGRQVTVPPAGQVGETREEEIPFENLGEFVRTLRWGPETPEEREFQMTTGASGGILVPTQLGTDILMVDPEEAIVRPRAFVIPAGDPPDAKITFPALKQGSAGVLGGATLEWIAEGGDKPETDAELEEISLSPEELAGHVVVTDRLLRNTEAATPFITKLLRGASTNGEEYAFIRGDGVGKPKGTLGANCKLNVARNTATDVKFADIAGMLALLFPESWGKALWLANVTTLPKLVRLADDAGNSIFIAGDATKGIPATLFGIPIKFTGKTPPLGTEGDLMLVDFSYYIVKDGSGPYISASEHVYFKKNKTVVKIYRNVDGDWWVKEPLLLEDGSTEVSPVVVLK